MKKTGRIIKRWQTHILSTAAEDIEKAKKHNPGFEMDKLIVFTGTVVEDPTGQWRPGFHMRSSLILKHDKKTGIVETQNTIYKLEGEEGGDIFQDIGVNVLKIFY